jgi:hypothetical protein
MAARCRRVSYRKISGATVAIIALLQIGAVSADSLISVRLGPTTVEIPDDWIDPAWREVVNLPDREAILLTPPLDEIAGTAGLRTDAVASASILLRYDRAGTGADDIIATPLEGAAEWFPVATPEQAALAFKSIPFESLHGGPASTSGKAASHALVFVGSVATERHGTIAVTARVEYPETTAPPRLYTILALLTERDTPFAVIVTLDATRPLEAGDLGWIDLAAAIADGRHQFDK